MSLSPDQRDRLILLDRAHGVQELLRGMAHDIRNNLQVLALASQLGDSSRTPDIDRRVEQAIEEINRDLELLGSLGRHQDGATSVDLGDLVKTLERSVAYQRNYPPTVVRFGAYPECRLEVPPAAALQILLDLIANAKEATPPDHPVEVTFRQSLPSVSIEIADRGAGFPADAGLPLVSSGSALTHGGTGVFAARSVAARFGGTVEWRPREGGGTVAAVTLPAGR